MDIWEDWGEEEEMNIMINIQSKKRKHDFR